MNIETALAKAGSINQLAKIAGVTRQVVQHWKKAGAIPETRVADIKAARPEWFR